MPVPMMRSSDERPCLQRVLETVVGGTNAEVRVAVQPCLRAGVTVQDWEQVVLAAETALYEAARSPAEAGDGEVALAMANRFRIVLETVPWERDLPGEGGLLSGHTILATLPGDTHDAGRQLWRGLLVYRGMSVEDLGMRAPALVAAHAAKQTPDALGVSVFSTKARAAVQSLVAALLRRGLRIPLLLGGPGVDEAFARWVAVPGGGAPYWGGVYYCEDGREMLEVLRQIVLFEPPPVAHDHSHGEPQVPAEGCESCGDCPLVGACDAPGREDL